MDSEVKKMNRTQKAALYSLILCLMCLAFGLFMLLELVFLKTMYCQIHRFYCVLILIAIGIGLPVMFRKQSSKEVESDERDKLIQLKAVLAASVAGCIFLAAAVLICRFAVGLSGTISIWAMTLINMLVFLLAMMVYWIAILLQYYTGSSNVEK
jgi:putative Mn2+ efflux pump MntP